MRDRPAIAKGADVPPKAKPSKPLTEEELEEIAKQNRAWIQQGMAQDAKK